MERLVDTKKIQEFVNDCNARVLVGYPSGLTHTDKEGNAEETAELAKKLHFGTSEIPARPFLEDALESKQEELLKEIKTQAANAKKGEANWGKVGAKAMGAVQDFVRSEYYRSNVPNSPMTIEKKGSDMPLIDTGNLVNSTTFLIEEGKK